jgi:hypothetical protein
MIGNDFDKAGVGKMISSLPQISFRNTQGQYYARSPPPKVEDRKRL